MEREKTDPKNNSAMKAAELGSEEVMHPDRISHLPNDLLFRILSLVPVRTAMSTSLLSKRWNYVRKMMPTLVYDETCPYNGSLGSYQFCVMSLPLHEALKTLNIRLGRYSDSIDTLFRSTVLNNPNVFKTLLILELQGHIVLSFVDSPVCFPSLKTLHLKTVKFRCEKSFKGILSACPVLEDLILQRLCGFGRFLFSISSPSLQRLSITPQGAYCYYDHTISEISAPSLKYLEIFDRKGYYNFFEDMPKLVDADVSVDLSKIYKLQKVLSSLQRLSLRLYPKMVVDFDRLILDRLLHLELGYSFCSNLLLCLLKYFPNLRSLKLVQPYHTVGMDQLNCLVSVPKCLSFHLEILQWSGYGGTLNEREAAVYILKNALVLKTATISLQKTSMDNFQIMMMDLRSMSKASASCQLVIES